MEQIQCKSSCHRCIGLGSRRWCLSFQTGGNTSQNVADSGLLRENSTRGFFPLCLWVQSGFEANGPFLLLHPVSCCHCCFFLVAGHHWEKLEQMLRLISSLIWCIPLLHMLVGWLMKNTRRKKSNYIQHRHSQLVSQLCIQSDSYSTAGKP